MFLFLFSEFDVAAADELIEHLRNENGKLLEQVAELRSEVASIRHALTRFHWMFFESQSIRIVKCLFTLSAGPPRMKSIPSTKIF